jgi:uncharacterized protein
MDKIELDIITITDSVSNRSFYNVILEEKEGKRRIVIVIGYAEAQSIAVSLDETARPRRPLTHDLFYNVCNIFDIELQEVLINDVVEGVYHALLVCKKGEMIIEIDSRTSDALALALRFKCPIFIKKQLLMELGSSLESSTQQSIEEFEKELDEELGDFNLEEELSKADSGPYGNHTLEELREMLDAALMNEDYEKAARLRDEISKRKK